MPVVALDYELSDDGLIVVKTFQDGRVKRIKIGKKVKDFHNFLMDILREDGIDPKELTKMLEDEMNGSG
ncbi:MAG: hypothetical protein ACXQS8_06720 [Candidatus Helarchaeales archaeon]